MRLLSGPILGLDPLRTLYSASWWAKLWVSFLVQSFLVIVTSCLLCHFSVNQRGTQWQFYSANFIFNFLWPNSVTMTEIDCTYHIGLRCRFCSSTWFLPAEFCLWPPWHIMIGRTTFYHQSRPLLEMSQVSPSVPGLHVVPGGQHFDLSAQHTCCRKGTIPQGVPFAQRPGFCWLRIWKFLQNS